MKLYKKNLKKLINGKVYNPNMEHDSCGVGLVVSTEGKKSRKIVEYGIEALKAVWHRGAVDADGKTGDGAGIHIEISTNFFKEKIENYGRPKPFRCRDNRYQQFPQKDKPVLC